MPAPKLAVSKDYAFLTFQGEGPRLGRRTVFLRLAGCNLTCTWCDTKYTWDWKNFDKDTEVQVKSVYEVAEHLSEIDCSSLTITGGEPLLQEQGIISLLKLGKWKEVNVETNGTVYPLHLISSAPEVNYVVSPKLQNSGHNYILGPNSYPDVGNYEAPIRGFVKQGADFKFVCQSISDLDEVQATLNRVFTYTPWPNEPSITMIAPSKIWIMPEGTDSNKLTETARILAPAVLARGWNLTTRMHQFIWGNERAR